MLRAAVDCIGTFGLSKTTVEDVARAAGSSRATLYRLFPGGRDQLVREAVAWEAGRFFAALAAAVANTAGLAHLLEEAIVFAHKSAADHEVLQKVLRSEPDLLVTPLTVESSRILAFLRGFLTGPLAAAPLREGVGIGEAADLLGRLLLSYLQAPGRWDLADRDSVRTLVATEMVAAVCDARAEP